jgi:hypothetical protein
MLFPRTHAWTPLQKWLIVTTAITLIALCGAGIYYYERHSRTTDSVLVGTWAFPPLGGDDIYFRLDSNHTFHAFADPAQESSSIMRGIWFGGGSFVYFRRPTFDDEGFVTAHPLLIWRLENITPNELQVRLNPGGIPRTVRRVRPESP